MTDTLRFIGVTKDARTAGPGKRLELFTKGCIRGVINPCEGCFNESSWTFEGQAIEKSVDEAVNMIDRDAWNRQVTFCGGEPMLQARGLAKVAKELKERDPSFHIVMYTAYKLDVLMKHGLKHHWNKRHGKSMLESLDHYSRSWRNKSGKHGTMYTEFTIATPNDIKELMQHVDIIVDGDYKHEFRLTNHKTMHEGGFIGSKNQRIIYCKLSLSWKELQFDYADEYMEYYHNLFSNTNNQCKCCGHPVSMEKSDKGHIFCDDTCAIRYERRNEEMKAFGGA